jgi:hypothetical protein
MMLRIEMKIDNLIAIRRMLVFRERRSEGRAR